MRPFLFFSPRGGAVRRTAPVRKTWAGCPCHGRSLIALAFAGVISVAAAAEPRRFASGPNQVSLIELYTSEGCSSCPPAEKWLAGRKNEPGLWRDFVPVAFHVDYWNRLGWTDRFSTRAFTQRQYDLAAAWGGDSVYTPCFVRDGAEWRTAGARDLRPRATPTGLLAVEWDGATVRAEFTPVKPGAADDFEVHVALLGGGLVSKVTAGENSGETLRQEFVALGLTSHPLAANRAEFLLPATTMKTAPARALAAWVTRRGEFASVQATGGWLK
jgi:hypothetical protein